MLGKGQSAELYLTVCYWKSQIGVRKNNNRNRPTCKIVLDGYTQHNSITGANLIISKINKMWTDVNNNIMFIERKFEKIVSFSFPAIIIYLLIYIHELII